MLPKPSSKGTLGGDFEALLTILRDQISDLNMIPRTQAYRLLGTTRSCSQVRRPCPPLSPSPSPSLETLVASFMPAPPLPLPLSKRSLRR